MFKLIRLLLFGVIASTALILVAPASAQANDRDGYWNNYWRWYDGRYRPYYQRRYYRQPYYDAYRYPYNYGRRYYYNYPQRYGYGPFYYYDRGYREGVNLGPLRFEWR